MKRIFVALLAIAIAFGSFAQKGNDITPEKRALKASAFLKRKLALSDDQKDKVYQAVLERATKLGELRAQNLEKTALLQQSKPIRDNFNAQMKLALTPDQYVKWEELKSDKGERKDGKNKNKPPRGNRDKNAEKGDSLGDLN